MKTVKLEEFNKSKKPWEVEGIEWREVKFTDVVEILDKYRIPVKKKDRKPGPYPYCGANGVIDFIDGYTHDGEFLMLAEDGGFFGKGEATAYIMKGKFWANNHVHVLKVKPNIYLKFLYHFSIFYDFTPHLRGATRPKLSQIGMRKIKIPLPFRNGKPDLETQKKIVEYIETNFEKIDRILEKKKKELEFLDELWESVLEHAFKPKEGEEWREVGFEKLILKKKYSVGKVKVRKNLLKKGKIPVIDQSQEFIRGYLNTDELKYKGILPVIIFGDHTKIIKFVDFPFIVGADGVKILIPNKSLVHPKYLYWLLKTTKLPEKGYARHFKFLKKALYIIPFRNGKPDLEKQKEIAQYLDNVYQKIKTLKEKIQNQIIQLEELKESILDEVFRHDKAR